MPRSRFSPEYEILLRNLINARKDANVTQQQVALKLGKPQSHVSKCESQEREISLVDLRLWCLALDLNLSEFIQEWEKEIENRNFPDTP